MFAGKFDLANFIKAMLNQRQKGFATKPIVIRVKGHYEEEARKQIREYQLQEEAAKGKSTIYMCKELDEMAMLSVELAIE